MMRYIVYLFSSLTVLLFGAIYWLFFTSPGFALLVRTIDSQVEVVSIGPVQGTIKDSLYLSSVSVRTDAIHVDARNTNLQIDPLALLSFRIKLYEIHIEQLDLMIPDTGESKESNGTPLPFSIDIVDGTVAELTVNRGTLSHKARDLSIKGNMSDQHLVIDHLSVSDEQFTLRTNLDLNLAPPQALTSTYHLWSHNPDAFNGQTLSIHGQLRGNIDDMRLEGLMDSPQRVQYTGKISNPGDALEADLTLTADDLDLNTLVSQPWRLTRSTLKIQGTLDNYQFEATGGLTVPEVPPLSYTVEGSGDVESMDILLVSLRLDQAEVSFNGKVSLTSEPSVSGSLQARQIPLSLAYEELEGMVNLQGLIAYEQESGLTLDLHQIDGSLFERPIQGSLKYSGKDIGAAMVDGQARLGTNTLTIKTDSEHEDFSFHLDAPDLNAFHKSLQGRLTATGNANPNDPLTMDAEVIARGIPFSVLDPALAGHLDFDSNLTWGQQLGYRVQLTNLGGNLFGQPVAGNARLAGSSLQDLEGEGQLMLGENRLRFKGSRAAGDLDFELDAPVLAAAHPKVAGDLQATGHIRLGPDEPMIEVTLRSDRLIFNEHNIGGLRIDISPPSTGSWTASATWSNWRYNDSTLGSLQANYAGTLESGQLHLVWQHPDADLDFTINLNRNDREINGSLQSGTINLSDNTWRSDQNISFEGSIVPAGLTISSHCWHHQAARACFPLIDYQNDTGNFRASLTSVPVEIKEVAALLDNLNLPTDLAVKTLLDLELDASLQGSVIEATFEASLPHTQLTWSADEDPLVMGFNANGHILGNRLEMALESVDSSEHAITSKILIPDLTDPASLNVELNLNGAYVPMLTAFVSQISEGQGDIIANLQGNTTASPMEVSGEIRIPPGASVAIPAAGIRISNIEFTAYAGDANLVQFHGTGNSGDGTLTIAGDITRPLANDREVRLSLSGQDFRTMNTKDLMIVSSPELEIRQSANRIRISGDVTLVDGQIRYGDFATGARSISSDVRVDDAEPDSSLLARADIELQLRVLNKVHIRGFGLDANIAGNLNLDQGPYSPPRAHGTLTLSNGTFSRYGQTLMIERGRLIYSGPLNNPNVDVVTSRTIRSANEEIKVTLSLSGPANNIRSQITSEPAMSDANALSWLILGQPLTAASSEEGHNLAGTALSLGLRQALPITQEIGATLGLDELNVSAETSDSASIIAGKRVSRDLYVRYNYDVFSRIGGVLFNYALTPQLSVEAQSGESKSLELIYTF